MGSPAEKVAVSIVDADGKKLRDHTFKLPLTSDQLINTIKEKGYGVGDLLDADGDDVPLSKEMQAGTYTYHVTGAGAAGAAGGPGPADEVQARLRSASKFAADIPVAEYTHAATVVLDNVIVTYAHEDHATWQIGESKQVNVHSTVDAHRRAVRATVDKIFPLEDIIVLKVDQDSTGGVKVEGAVPDAGVYTGAPYLLLGQSTQAQSDLTSTAHGSIAATELDAWLHIRGDTQSGKGDSGGGVFALESGKLVGVCVGNDEHTKKSVIVPTAVLMTLIKGH